jgi:ribosomal protein S7
MSVHVFGALGLVLVYYVIVRMRSSACRLRPIICSPVRSYTCNTRRLLAKVRSMEEHSFAEQSDSEILETASNNSLSEPTTAVSEPAGREQCAVQVC